MHNNDVPNSPYPKQGLQVVPNAYRYLADSSHAMHMPSHLFVELGDWRQAAYANRLSIQAGHNTCTFLEDHKIFAEDIDTNTITAKSSLVPKINAWTTNEKLACDSGNVYHALEWLHYADLQLGKFSQAKLLVKKMQKIADLEKQSQFYFWSYRMQARQQLETKTLAPVAALPKPLIEQSKDKNWAAFSECSLLLADGVSAVSHHQNTILSAIDARFKQIITQLSDSSSLSYKNACELAHNEVLALNQARLDKNAENQPLKKALALEKVLSSSQQALTLPMIPAQEIAAEIMQDQPKRFKQIKILYQEELKHYPHRRLAVQGLKHINAKLNELKISQLFQPD
jgi:hypothetical protein